MYKLVLILIVLFTSQNNLNANSSHEPSETDELCQWEYWNAFSESFNKTADFWEAESAALEAEELAEDRTEVEEWLKKHKQKNHTQDCSETTPKI